MTTITYNILVLLSSVYLFMTKYDQILINLGNRIFGLGNRIFRRNIFASLGSIYVYYIRSCHYIYFLANILRIFYIVVIIALKILCTNVLRFLDLTKKIKNKHYFLSCYSWGVYKLFIILSRHGA